MKRCMSIILTILMVFSMIMIPTDKVYGQADVTAPELKSIRVDKKSAVAGDKITFTAEVTDDISGVNLVVVYVDIPGTKRTETIWLYKKEDNIYEGSYTINENDPNGIWKINYIYLSDNRENYTHLYNNEYGDTDYSSCDFEVKGNEKTDVTGPELKSIRVDKKNAVAGNKITFTAEVTDDISGVNLVVVYVDIPGTKRTETIWLYKKEDNIYEGSYTINENDPNGIWKINYIYLSDNRGNYTYLYNNEYGDTDYSSCDFEVNEDNNPIQPISGTTVITSNQTLSNKIINGDLYIAPNVALSTNNLTVNGNVYVLGGLLGGNISVYGTVYCNSSRTGYTTTLSPGMFSWYGSCSIYGLTCRSRIVEMIPLRFDDELVADAKGNLNLKGATLNIADMMVDGQDVPLDSKGRFNQDINIGESDQVMITRHIDGWYDLTQTVNVKHEKPEKLEIESLPNKTIYQDGEKLDSKGLKVKAIYKDGTEKDVTNYVDLSEINGLGINKIKVTYRGCETTFDIQVNEIKAESISLDKEDITLEIGKTEQLNAKILPNNTSNQSVTYKSSDESIVSVDHNGKITALKEGNATIIATTSNDKEAQCIVKVIKHTHQWNEGKVTKESTCTEAGEKEYTCETCGETKTEEIEAKGHEWNQDYTVDKKATCTEKGEESIHCKVCGEIKEGSQNEIAAAGHQWNEGKVIKEPTCTKAGEKEYTCETCGETKTEEIQAKGHEWNQDYTVDKQATCTEKGEESIHCKVCGEIKEGSKKEIAIVDHQWNEGEVIEEPTCTETGEKEYTCEICGATKKEEIEATGHKWENDYLVDEEPTCTKDGMESIHCRYCSEIKEGSEHTIPALHHPKTEIRNAKKATYTSEGYTGDTYCKICGQKIAKGKKIKKLIAKIPGKVVISKVTAGKKKFTISYKKVKEATKYQIQYSTKSNMKSAKTKTVTKTTNTITKLKSKNKYYVRVRAINVQGKAGSWSKISKTKVK